jgi:hypothetical protein
MIITLRLRSLLIPCFSTLLLLFMGVLPSIPAKGQSVDDNWSQPVNLSESGRAASPVMVIDETGNVHVFWMDEFAGYFYRSSDGESWSDRERLVPPFDSYRPVLTLGRGNRVHAFWTDDSNNFYLSRGTLDEMSNGSAWESSGWIAESVVDFGAQANEQGVIQVSYIYNESDDGLSGGVAYRRSNDNGGSWSEPVYLYQTPYIRGLEAGTANIDLASTELGEENLVLTGWDNPVRKQVLLARSLDGGETWDDPFLVDGPDPTDPSMVPSDVHIATFDENALLVWQRANSEGVCNIYYRWSGDSGNTWSDRQRILEDTQGCPQDINFISGGDGYALLQVTFPFQILFQAWDGAKWSDPQIQSQLSALEDPETFGVINFNCLQFVGNPIRETISMIGCDSTGGDIWFAERNIGNTTTWYPSPPLWIDPVVVSEADTEFGIPILVADQDETMHAIWSQHNEGNNPLTTRSSIYYARWDGESWSRPYSILNSPEGSTLQPHAVLDQSDQLLIVWVDSDSNQVYFSKAATSRALRGSDWSIPEPLPAPVPGARSPHILSVGASQVYVIYSVPLNEARGIYMTVSNDNGVTWSEPKKIHDAAQAGWDMADSPYLAKAEDGSLHAVFSRYSLPDSSGPMGTYYARSEDNGETWSQPDLVEENPVYWSRIVSGSDGILHRIWQSLPPLSSSFVVRHQYSLDQGHSWTPPEIISTISLAQSSVITSMAVPSSQVMHLFNTVQTTSGDLSLQHWVWTGDQWLKREDFELDADDIMKLNSLSAAASPTGRVAVIFSGTIKEESSLSDLENMLLFSIRALDISIPPSTPRPVLLSSPTPTPQPAVEPTITPTPTIDISALENAAPRQPITNRWTSLGIGLSLAVILVAFALGATVVKRRR